MDGGLQSLQTLGVGHDVHKLRLQLMLDVDEHRVLRLRIDVVGLHGLVLRTLQIGDPDVFVRRQFVQICGLSVDEDDEALQPLPLVVLNSRLKSIGEGRDVFGGIVIDPYLTRR